MKEPLESLLASGGSFKLLAISNQPQKHQIKIANRKADYRFLPTLPSKGSGKQLLPTTFFMQFHHI